MSIAILGIGLVAVAGLAVTSMERTRASAKLTDQLLVAQEALERAALMRFDSLTSGMDSTVTAFGKYTVSRSVAGPSGRLKTLTLTVSGLGSLSPRQFGMSVARPTALP